MQKLEGEVMQEKARSRGFERTLRKTCVELALANADLLRPARK